MKKAYPFLACKSSPGGSQGLSLTFQLIEKLLITFSNRQSLNLQQNKLEVKLMVPTGESQLFCVGIQVV